MLEGASPSGLKFEENNLGLNFYYGRDDLVGGHFLWKVSSLVINGGSNGQGHENTSRSKAQVAEGYLEYTKEKEKGQVNQFDVGTKRPTQQW